MGTAHWSWHRLCRRLDEEIVAHVAAGSGLRVHNLEKSRHLQDCFWNFNSGYENSQHPALGPTSLCGLNGSKIVFDLFRLRTGR